MKRPAAEPVSVLRWDFQQNRRILTCAVRADSDGASFDVTVVPHWDVCATSIETFDTDYPLAVQRRLWEQAGLRSIEIRRMSFGAGVVISGTRDGGPAAP